MSKAKSTSSSSAKYPGVRMSMDGSEAVVAMETAASEAAGAYPITPSTQMGEGWALAVAAGKTNVNGRRLIFFEPEGEHAAAAVTAGMSMTGLRSTNFSSGQGIAYMHESLYAAVGKRLTYVLNVACRAMTKHSLNVHAGHDDYHAIDDTGFFQMFSKSVQEAADLTLIAHRIAELSLNPGISAQDGFLTSHVIETMDLPEPELVKEYLGDPSDLIDSPTPAQRMVFGAKRRRIPEMFDFDYPAMVGVVQNQDSYAQGVAAQRPFYFDHIQELADQAMAEYAALSGRRYSRVTGYRTDDAEYVIIGQGSVVANAEAVCDYLREKKGLKVGVVNVTMFRPFPSDLITKILKGKKAATVLERVDQPLAVDLPLIREIRAAMSKGLENGRAKGAPPHRGVAALRSEEVPEFFSGCFGMGSRDLQPADLIAAVENMLENGGRQRQFYLSIDFVRPGTKLPKLEIHQQQLLEGYPHLAQLALKASDAANLMPKGSVSIRIHSVGGWGAITMGKNVAMTASELLGLYIKANPKYGSEKKGQPTTFYATLAKEPIRLNCELRQVSVVLSPDPNVFRHSNPLAGLSQGGVFVIQWDKSADELWQMLPRSAQDRIKKDKLRVYYIDAFKIAMQEASEAELRYRMQGTAFMGAFFKVSPFMESGELDRERLMAGIRAQLAKKFGRLGGSVVEDNMRVIERGFEGLQEFDASARELTGAEGGALRVIPDELNVKDVRPGIGDQGRFWEQITNVYKSGSDPLADPFVAISAIPAVTTVTRDMTDVRFEVPQFIAERCTGCGQCWSQCPDSAIPGLVTPIDQLLEAAIRSVEGGTPFDRLRQLVKPLAREAQRIVSGGPFAKFTEVLSLAYKNVLEKAAPSPEQREVLDRQFLPVRTALTDFPLAKTAPFFDVPEGKEKGSGALLSITVNPDTCKGCMLCVDVCPDGALRTIKQEPETVETLRRNWRLWKQLPDTDDRYINISSYEQGIGILPSMLLKKNAYRGMVGGDGACMGCAEKTVLHLVLGAVNALMQPRVDKHIQRLQDLIAKLDEKARTLLAAGADLEKVSGGAGKVDVKVAGDKAAAIERINRVLRDLKDLLWRYTKGPSGKGRALCGIANSTGCSSVWASTYPFNPYPVPWVNQLFQDSPSVAIGIFEGHMRKMGDGFIAVRRAELELAGEYDAAAHEPAFQKLTWLDFSAEEFDLCPPLIAVGGDGAMFDIGFQNLSRMMASGKPIRVVVLDTQVYSNTGGQACTSGFTSQISDMAAFGKGQRGKEETRKELALVAFAHRNTYVLQSSQASPSHLLGGVLRGLQERRPALFLLHCPCAPEHGIGDDSAFRAARLSLESRAYPFFVYDPEKGASIADCVNLDGNPDLEERWPTYELKFAGDDGKGQSLTLPLTVADWACTEARFKKHFTPVKADAGEELVPFHEYLDLAAGDREGKTPFIYTIDAQRKLARFAASADIVRLAEDRLLYWSQLRQLAGVLVTDTVKDRVSDALGQEFDAKMEALRREYEGKLTDLKASYPSLVARRMAEGLLRADGSRTVAELLSTAQAMEIMGVDPIPVGAQGRAAAAAAPSTAAIAVAEPAPAAAAQPASAAAPAAEERLVMEPYIESARCTTCNECTNLNKKIFAYNDKKQAYVKDAKGGPFKHLVMAAERCPVGIIHPGSPQNPKEKNLDELIKRAEPFNK
ncbi:MAG: 2-oxoacid:acceptor oxidoreductase family protein [Planctomycetes bacterium]|nr:2-oxoacid:acceptor oxidoreductase family protein [Planctomycetota bacterium]